jgi:hypothetical protein
MGSGFESGMEGTSHSGAGEQPHLEQTFPYNEHD